MLPRSLSRSLLLSFALSVPCAPWPLFFRSSSHARVTQQSAGHPLLPVPRSCLPLRTRCIATLGAARPHWCSTCSGPLSPLCLCLVPSFSLSSCARTVPSFPLLLHPAPSPCVPLPSEHDARQCAVRDSPFLGYIQLHHPRLPGRLPGPLIAQLCVSCPIGVVPRLHAQATPDTYHVSAYDRGTARMIHDTLRGMLLVGPCSLPRSLFVSPLSCAWYTTKYGAPAALAFPLLALGRPCVLALFPLLLPLFVHARCRALCVASPLTLCALFRRLCPLGSSALPALAYSFAPVLSACTGHVAGKLHARYGTHAWGHLPSTLTLRKSATSRQPPAAATHTRTHTHTHTHTNTHTHTHTHTHTQTQTHTHTRTHTHIYIRFWGLHLNFDTHGVLTPRESTPPPMLDMPDARKKKISGMGHSGEAVRGQQVGRFRVFAVAGCKLHCADEHSPMRCPGALQKLGSLWRT